MTTERHDLTVSFPAGRFDLVVATFFQSPLELPRAEQDAVRAFWTAERMRAAVGRGPQRPLAKPGGGPKPGTSDPSLGTEWTAGRVTVGEAFFQIGSSLYVCSGNAVDDVEDGVTVTNLVVTAGHCVNDGGSAFVTNFLYIPAYDPNQPRTSGQPHGTKLISCWGATSSDTVGGSSDYRLRCNMTGGSSGGPWLLDSGTPTDPANPINNADVSDVQVSVNSFGYRGEKNAMYGPIFGTTVESLHTAAVAASDGAPHS